MGGGDLKDKKIIYCKECVGEIKNIEDLVVINRFISLRPYHEKCIPQFSRRNSIVFRGSRPLGVIKILVILPLIVGIFVKELWYLSFITIIALLYIFLSWFIYERYLR
jgi:hypothetical protein